MNGHACRTPPPWRGQPGRCSRCESAKPGLGRRARGLTLTVLAAIAQLERKTIRERQAEGIAIAKRNGVYDRVPKLAPGQIQLARQRIAQDVPKTKVARDLGVSRQTLYAALNGSGKYAEVSS